MKVYLDNIQYHPERGTGSALLVPPLGGGFHVSFAEAEAEARLPTGAGNWGNDEVMAVVRDVLGSVDEFTKRTGMAAELYPEEGFTVSFRPTPPAPVDAPPQVTDVATEVVTEVVTAPATKMLKAGPPA